jgi:hypothetical protein
MNPTPPEDTGPASCWISRPVARHRRLSASLAVQTRTRQHQDAPGRASQAILWPRSAPRRLHRRARRRVAGGWTVVARFPALALPTGACQPGDGSSTAPTAPPAGPPGCPLGTMAKPLHGLVQITPGGPFKDRHDGLDPAPLPDDVSRREQPIGVVPGFLLLPRGGIAVGKRRDRTDRREEAVLTQHTKLGPMALDPVRRRLLPHDLLPPGPRPPVVTSLRRRRYDLKLWIGSLRESATYPPA